MAKLCKPIYTLLLSLSVTVAIAQKGATDNIQIFKDLEKKWMDAVVNQDTVTLKQILAPEYVLTVAIEGETLEDTPRVDYIDACKGFYVIHSYSFDQFKIHIQGDIAVVSSLYKQKATIDGTIDRSAEFFLTDIWQKKNGRWWVIQRYSSRPEKPE